MSTYVIGRTIVFCIPYFEKIEMVKIIESEMHTCVYYGV